MTNEGDPVPETRPPSPFLILLLGAAATALAAEWLRFGWGPWLAAGPAAAGASATVLGVVRAFRRRRSWRERTKDESATTGRGGDRPIAPAPAETGTILSVRSDEGGSRPAERPSRARVAPAARREAPSGRDAMRIDPKGERTHGSAGRPLEDDEARGRGREPAVR